MDLFKRLRNRPDSEHQQAFARLTITTIGLAYAIAIYQIDRVPSILPCVWFLSAYLLVSLVILALIFVNPGVSRVRRYLAMFLDITGTTTVLYMSGQKAAVFLFVPLWVVIGPGLRYGTSYLYTAMVLGVISYLVMVANTAYWRDDVYLSIGFGGCLIILPLFFSSLLRKLSSTNAELVKLTDALKRMATHDSLTGLPNRGLFIEELSHELSVAQRHKERLAVLFIDVDRFKTVNDTYGHLAGDNLLKTISSRLRRHVRKSDLVARLAGDEFVVMLTNVDRDTAAYVTHKLIRDIATPIQVARHALTVTASIGIAIYPESATSVDGIMAKADAAMYRSKQAGRNRMMVDGDAEPVFADVSAQPGTTSEKQDQDPRVLSLKSAPSSR